MHQAVRIALCVSTLAFASAATPLTWGNTKFLVALGDSYTTDGFNISAGVDSPVPGFTSSNGPNWVQALGSTFNVADTKIFDLASGGATIDAALVPPYQPTVLSIVDQVNQFNRILAPKPEGARWSSDNTLFAFWIGINDVGNSFGWMGTNVTTPTPFYQRLMARLTTQLESLYEHGARNFLFLTVPPTDRAPLWLQQGRTVSTKNKDLVSLYNAQLISAVRSFQTRHRDIQRATVFDTQPVFNTLLDNANTLGYVNVTGWCEAYQNGTPSIATQIAPCAPVSNYFWLNSLHPLFTVHSILAQAISTNLST